MIKPHLARVDYTWKWTPNRLGKDFDASSDLVHNFNTWERGTLIKNYGVDFYSAAPPPSQRCADGSQRRRLEALRRLARTLAGCDVAPFLEGGATVPPSSFCECRQESRIFGRA